MVMMPTEKQELIKPMLAAKVEVSQLVKLAYPILGQVKYDGIRAIMDHGSPMSRSMKEIPNYAVQDFFKKLYQTHPFTQGWDGELLVGNPTDKAVCMNTTSGVMSRDGNPDFRYYLFDNWAHWQHHYHNRRTMVVEAWKLLSPEFKDRVVLCDEVVLENPAAVEFTAEAYMDAGNEGLMLRNPYQPYKYGRSTLKQQGLLKLKAFADAEATVVGFEELYRNHNEAFINETGHQVRSSHQENKVPANTLGALVVTSPSWPRPFNIGTGFSAELRQHIWNSRDVYKGYPVKFKYLASGMKDVPRHPVFIAWRHSSDK